MFRAYLDASGDFNSQPVLAIAGFIADVDSWIEWEKEWLSRLRQDGLESFHRKVTLWDRAKRGHLINDLCSILRVHVACKTGCAIVNEKIDAILSEDDKARWRIESYSLAGRNVAKEVRIWASKWGGGMPELVFEDGDIGKGDLREMLVSQGYPEPIFRPKRRTVNKKSGIVTEGAVPLQAADLLAYELFAMIREVHEGRSRYKTGQLMRFRNSDLDKINGECGIVTDDHLLFMKDGLAQIESTIWIPPVQIRVK